MTFSFRKIKYAAAGKKAVCLLLSALLFAAAVPGRFFAAETETGMGPSKGMGVMVIQWKDIPDLIREGNPAWLELCSDEMTARKLTESACEAFRNEMYVDVDLIDESLEMIRQRKQELKELEPDAVIDKTGKTATEALKEETASEKLLQQERKNIVKAVAGVVLPAMNQVKKAEESLEPQFEIIVNSVRESVIARRQLAAELEALEAENTLLQAKAKAAKAFFSRGMISEQEMNDTVLMASETALDLGKLYANLDKLDRSIKKSLGIDRNREVQFGDVPAPQTHVAALTNREADLVTILEGSKELKDAKDPKSFSVYGSEKAQKAEISRIEGELTEKHEQLYTDMVDTEEEFKTADAAYREQEGFFRIAELQYAKGKISLLSYMEAEAALKAAESSRTVAVLACRKARDSYCLFLEQNIKAE